MKTEKQQRATRSTFRPRLSADQGSILGPEVKCLRIGEHLCVHKALGYGGTEISGKFKGYCVSHIRSGMLIHHDQMIFDKQKEARKFAELLADNPHWEDVEDDGSCPQRIIGRLQTAADDARTTMSAERSLMENE